MPIPKNKAELIVAIQTNYTKLQEDLADIPVEMTKISELDGHKKNTKMSVANLVAYLIGWGALVLKWQRLHIAEEEIDFPETGFQWNELGLLAQKFYSDYAKEDYPSLLKKLDQTVIQILALIDQLDDKALYAQPWYKDYPLGRMIQLNTSSPYKNARARIRKWKKEKGLNGHAQNN